MVDVSVDDSLTCWGVHWNIDTAHAREQFRQWGFQGIDGFRKVDVLNGNAARTHVRDLVLSKKGGNRYYWKGNYDWGVTADSAIYTFSYDIYTGEDHVSGPDAKWMANYRAPEAKKDEHDAE